MKKRAERRDLHHFRRLLDKLWFKRHGQLRDDLFCLKITDETTFFRDVFFYGDFFFFFLNFAFPLA